MAQQHPLPPARITRTHLLRLLPVVAGLCLAVGIVALSANAASAQSGDSEETCPGGGYNPTPTAVEIQAVPIVVESTTSDYFVLYVRHDIDEDTSKEIPVLIEEGTEDKTTLAENIEALPKERYRVEKYSIANPADIDGDCTDDITELDNLGSMNPLNPAAAIALSNGAVAIPDQDTFETLAYDKTYAYNKTYLKFVLFGLDTDRPGIFFVNTKTHNAHEDFMAAIGLEWSQDLLTGALGYYPDLVAPDGSQGVYVYEMGGYSTYHSFSIVARAYTVLAASMPLLSDNLAYNPSNGILSALRPDLPLYNESRVNLVFDHEILVSLGINLSGFLGLNPGEGYGFLRVMELDERPNPRDVVIYEALPNDLPRVAGIISTVPQTPLSHVNLRAVQDGVPNAYIRDALDDDDIDDLIGSYVRYTVSYTVTEDGFTEDGYTIREATRAEVDAHHAASRPAHAQTPQRDLSLTAITTLSDVGFDDWDAFGVKAANVAVLGTLEFPEGTVPDGFAIPFYFYDEFMKHNDFYDDIDEMLADADFQTDFDTQAKELKKLRKDIEDGETPDWIISAIKEMNKGFAEGINRRYRSSTNNEDLPGFSGAGLYDSKSQKPSEDEEDLAKSLKEVYASLWNFRAFVERDFHRVDHKATAMGILVHPSYQDELVNGVAVSTDPTYGTEGTYYANSQVGEDLVTNPEARSVPEELLLNADGSYIVLATSNKVAAGQLLMTDAQLQQLRRELAVIHTEFKKLYQPAADDPFAMEIEFKITSENKLAIKQARPWVFRTTQSPAGDTSEPPPTVTISGTAQVGQTLTADTSGITDEDGLTNVSYSYQWVRNDGNADTDINGATASTHELSDSDEGKTVRVRVSFTDDADNEESRTSAATATVAPRPALTAKFPASPYQSSLHKGDNDRPQVVVAFSEAVASFTKTTPSVKVANATVTSVQSHAEDGIANAYIFTLDPTGDDDITFALLSNADCDSGGICTSTGTRLIETPAMLTIAGPEATTVTSQLSVSDATANEEDDSTIDFVVKLDPASDESVTVDYATANGTATAGNDYTAKSGTLTFNSGETSKTVQVSIIEDTVDDNNETLTLTLSSASGAEISDATATGTITNSEPSPLTARFTSMPDTHDGSADISFLVEFTEDVSISRGDFRDFAFTVTNGDVTAAQRINHRSDLWTITVKPDSNEDVAITLPGNRDCDTLGPICTPGDNPRQLSNSPSATVTGPAGDSSSDTEEETAEDTTVTSKLSVADATASEEDDSTIDFVVTLDQASDESVSVDYATSNGTATAGDDYTAKSGTLTFASGETSKTISVSIIDDSTEENDETLTVTLTNASGAVIDDGTATGTITDSEPVPLTSSFSNVPDSHDGSAEFTFDLAFSEDVEAGYARIRDDAFAIDGGDINQANRKEQGSNQTWTITVEPEGNGAVSITLPATTDCDAAGAICTADGRKLSGSVELTVNGPEQQSQEQQNNPATGETAISGTPQVGETLTADTSGIADADGLTNVSYSYQWIAGGSDISGAAGFTYTLTTSQQGQTIQVKVSFTDDAGNAESLTSAATGEVQARPNTPATGAPAISSTPQVGETLTADTSGIADEDGLSSVSYRYQWSADGTNINGATGSSLTLTASQQGQTIQVRVDFEDDAGNSESLTSVATNAVAAKPVPLTASFSNVPDSHDGSTEFTFSENVRAGYERIRDDAFTIDGGNINQARRVTQGSNQEWTIRVKPDGNGAVTLTLPKTTDCGDTGAICTDDDRALSNSTSVSINGPT